MIPPPLSFSGIVTRGFGGEEGMDGGGGGGGGASSYCPASSTSREQMGVFISTTFGLGLYGP